MKSTTISDSIQKKRKIEKPNKNKLTAYLQPPLTVGIDLNIYLKLTFHTLELYCFDYRIGCLMTDYANFINITIDWLSSFVKFDIPLKNKFEIYLTL